jgi:rubrerythrin
MLAGKGFERVFNVSGGIKAWQSKTAVGPQDLGMDIFSGKEAPLDVLEVAYSLELGLCEFYTSMAARAGNERVKALFAQLSEIEIKHQMSIYEAYRSLSDTDPGDREAFEKKVEVKALEGGLSTQEYLDLFKPDLSSEIDVISLAMSIEAQALDLYQRVGLKIENPESQKIINKIADEEKTHLASLGKLMDDL